MVRKQFTFYESFFRAILRIQDDGEQAEAFRMVCNYALYGIKPKPEELSDHNAILFAVVEPVLKASRRKAKSGSIGGSSKQNASKNKDKDKDKDKDKNKDKDKIKIKDNSPDIRPGEPMSDFELFWAAYPKKVGKTVAEESFALVDQPVDELLLALDRQKRSNQWAKDGGQFIPNPARWLDNRGWEDQLPCGNGVPKGASGRFGAAEMENLRRIMKEG